MTEGIDILIDKTNWKKYRFDEVCKQINVTSKKPEADGLHYVIGLEHIEPGNLHITKWETLEKETTFTRKFVKGQVLFGRRRAYQRKVAYAEFDGICSGDILVFEAIEENLIPELLPFLIQSDGFFEKALSTSAGSLSPRTKFKELADYEFLLPPKDEQKRLAELLWAADEMIEKEKKELESMEHFRKLTFEEHTSKKINAKLEDCLIVKKRKSKAPHTIDKYIGLEHIESGSYFTLQYGNTQDVLADSYVFQKGDLLYSKLRPYLDKCIIADFYGICSTEIIVYDTKSNTSKEYVLNVLHSKAFLDYIVDKSFGTKMPRVSHELVSDYELYLPSKDEQEDILVTIRNIIKQEKKIKEQTALSQQIKKELINKIF
ncbi:MAG: restriction endonuclease subunit S [Bacteroidales bacterium]|nr:restriction endonuclease subunit S [Bacteroidales bacterium]